MLDKDIAGIKFAVVGLVYFAIEVHDGPIPASNCVKIGYTSSSDYKSRIGSLQTGNPRPLMVVAVIPDVPSDKETEVHLDCYYQAVRGEWFFLEGKTAEYVEKYKLPEYR